jgi:hypothetical protein
MKFIVTQYNVFINVDKIHNFYTCEFIRERGKEFWVMARCSDSVEEVIEVSSELDGKKFIKLLIYRIQQQFLVDCIEDIDFIRPFVTEKRIIATAKDLKKTH